MTFSVYLDTNAFISAYESASERSDEMIRVFDAIATGEFVGVTSELTLAELLPMPLSRGQIALGNFYLEALSGEGAIVVVPVTREILIETARLRSQYRTIKLPDAVHLASAMQKQCAVMLSGDRRLPLPATMHGIRLSPHTLGDIRRLSL